MSVRERRVEGQENGCLSSFAPRSCTTAPSLQRLCHDHSLFGSAPEEKSDAGDLDDGLPRGFLAGAIVEVWVALRLNWA